MSDPNKPMVTSYREPENAGELAHAIELFMLDQFGLSACGGCDADGGDMTFDLDGEEALILIGPSDRLFAIKRWLAGDVRFVQVEP